MKWWTKIYVTLCDAVLHEFAARRLNFKVQNSTFLPHWCMVASNDDTSITFAALTAYIAYRATNIARHAGGMSAANSLDLLHTLLHEAVRGHAPASSAVESTFVRCQRQRLT